MSARSRSRAALSRIAVLLGTVGALLFAPTASQAAVNPPTPPLAVTATRGNGSALITWDAPLADGGATISSYAVTLRSASPDVKVSTAGTARSVTVNGLALGVTYAVVVTARNAAGESVESDYVTVVPSKTPAKVPAAPKLSGIYASSRTLSISYSLGVDNGSTIIATEYSLDAGATWTAVATSPIEITGLINGKSYAVKVRSRNAVGNSAAAAKSGKPVPTKNFIWFTQPTDMSLENPTQELDVTSAGGVTTVKTSTPKVCTVNGYLVSAIAVGTCKLTATNSGDAEFSAAMAVTRSFPVTLLPAGKILLWSDEFRGTAGASPSTNWVADIGDGCAIGNCGWGNGERQYYTSGANRLDGTTDGNLIITATRAGASANRCYYGTCEWTSGKIHTSGKVSFTYGQLEARIKVPSGGGTWPAFWMLGSNIGSVGWPRCGELDILEALGNAPRTVWGTAHMADKDGARILRGGTSVLPSPLTEGYHVFAANWTPTSITWLVDGKAYFTVNKSDFGYPAWPFGPSANGVAPRMYAILNIAMGGNMGGSIASNFSSAEMSVDWVRYYQMNGLGSVSKF